MTDYLKNQSWIETQRYYGEQVYLNGSFEEIATPQGLKTNLLAHQKTAVKAMLDLEEKGFVNIFTDSPSFTNVVAETRAGVLSEKFGSGKTIEILALIVQKPIPKNVAEITYIPFHRCKFTGKRFNYDKWVRQNTSIFNGFCLEVRKIYHLDNQLKPNLIFVGKSVVLQWIDAIQRFTDLNFMVIDNYKAFKNFYNVFITDKDILNQYDIILIKNGNMTSKFFNKEIKLLENKIETKVKPIINVISELTRDYCWSRVIIDDFDTIHIPNTSVVIPACFTWFISATLKSACSRRPTHQNNVNKIIRNIKMPLNDVMQNKELFTLFNVCNQSEYIEDSINAGKVKFYIYKFTNPAGQYINLIGQMGANEIMEMLNGDALETAADRLGMSKGISALDIFETVLDKNYKKYEKTVLTWKYIPEVENYIHKLIRTDEMISRELMQLFRKNVRNAGPIKELDQIGIAMSTVNLREALKNIKDSTYEKKEKYGKAIDRVINNIKEGECPVCLTPLSSNHDDFNLDEFGDLGIELDEFDLDDEKNCDIIVLKCCGISLCGKCGIKGTKLQKWGKIMEGNCPKCRTRITFQDMIFLNKNFDLSTISEECFHKELTVTQENEPQVEENEIPDQPKEQRTGPPQNKLEAIIDIIRGVDNFDNKEETHVHIPSLLEGNTDLPLREPDKLKTVVFATFQETLNKIKKELEKEQIPYLQLLGTPSKINNIVNQFRNDINVLLINGANYCAGLNLQFADQIIYTNKILDVSIESQLAGRLQRLGRTSQLTIHYVLYDHEVEYLNVLHQKLN